MIRATTMDMDCRLPLVPVNSDRDEAISDDGGDSRRRDTQRKALSFDTCLVYAAGLLCPIVLPVIHMYISYQLFGQYSRNVDVHSCLCSCWDRVFKGNYEAGVSTYKHVYFNATVNTFKMWTITVIGVLLAYECCRHLCGLLFVGRLRSRMFVLWASALYSHYYSWWAYFNYWNDDFYPQWYHQMYFTLTEAASTMAVVRLADARCPLKPRLLLVVLDVSVAHIVISGFDQLVSNVVKGEGSLNQVTRDLGFFLPDLVHAVVAVSDLLAVSRSRHRLSRHVVSNVDFLASVSFVLLSLLLSFYL